MALRRAAPLRVAAPRAPPRAARRAPRPRPRPRAAGAARLGRAAPCCRSRPPRVTGGPAGTGPGGGVIDRPTTLPGTGRDSEFDLSPSKKKQKPKHYKVLLHNDDVNRREYVVQVLLKVVDGMSMDDAIQVMSEAHQYGKAVCIVAPQPDAEDYCEQLRSHGLIASIQPQGGKN